GISPLATAQLERLRAFYDSDTAEKPPSSRRFHRLLHSYYAQMIPPGVSVLEIGCGDGSLLETLAGRNVSGVDLSANQIELAQKRVPEGKFSQQAGEA